MTAGDHGPEGGTVSGALSSGDEGAPALDRSSRDNSAELSGQVASVFAAVERASGFDLCVKPLSTRWQTPAGGDIVPLARTLHQSDFCRAVKKRAMRACVKCDLVDLPQDCGTAVEPFVRTCHAGAAEVLVPLRRDGVLVAVVFIGQFSTGGGLLPELGRDLLGHLTSLALPLRSYLLDVLRQLDQQRSGPASGRRAVVDGYIRETLAGGPTLRGLAERLSLSPSRASHVVRELAGRSFQELVEDQRIAMAKDLLSSTEGTVTWVAHQTGFRDVAYFCRYFKRKSGSTPTQFRRRRRRSLEA